MSEKQSFIDRLYDWLFGEEDSNEEWLTETEGDLTSETVQDDFELTEETDTEGSDYISPAQLGALRIIGTFKEISSQYWEDGSRVTEATFSDDTTEIMVIWNEVNVMPDIKLDTLYELKGSLEFRDQRYRLINPDYRKVEEDIEEQADNPQVSNYDATQDKRHNIWAEEIKGRPLGDDSSWQALRREVFERDGYLCVNCGSRLNLTVDHIQPRSIGGEHKIYNLQTLCKSCHEDKHGDLFLERGFDATDDYGENYELNAKIRVLVRAIEDNSSVEINYTDRKGNKTRREIYPVSIYKGFDNGEVRVNKRAVYVEAYCTLRNAKRSFRFSRMKVLK